MDSVTALHAAVQTYPMSKPRPKSQNIGPGADLTIEIFADNSMVRRHWALMYLTLEGMVHTRADDGHVSDVTTNAMPHDVAAQNVGVGAGATTANTTIATQNFNLGIGLTENTTDTSRPVYFRIISGIGGLWLPGAGNESVPISGQIYGPQTDHPHAITATGLAASTPATTGATTGTGAVGGTVPKATHLASAGFGAKKTVATTEEVYRGPSPTGVTVLVDGVQRFGPFNSTPGVLDLTAFVSDQAAHTVTVKSKTNGAADVFIDIRDDVTTFATRPTG
jgi:hypothetical protein